MHHFVFLSFAPVVSRQKKEGAIFCRGSGEAVGCPVRTTERRCAQGAHSPLRHGSYRLNSYIPPVAKTMRRTQSLKLSIANYSKTSAFCGRHSAKFRNNQFATPRLLPWKGQTSPLPHTAATRRNLTRELVSPKIALKHPLVFACLFFVQFLERHRPVETKRIARLTIRMNVSPVFNVLVKVHEIEIGPALKYIMNAVLRIWNGCRIVQHAVFQPDNCIRWP